MSSPIDKDSIKFYLATLSCILKATETDPDLIKQLESTKAKTEVSNQEVNVGSINSQKTSQTYGGARVSKSSRSYPNPFSIAAFKRDWEKSEKEFKELKKIGNFKKANVPLDLEYQLFQKR